MIQLSDVAWGETEVSKQSCCLLNHCFFIQPIYLKKQECLERGREGGETIIGFLESIVCVRVEVSTQEPQEYLKK